MGGFGWDTGVVAKILSQEIFILGQYFLGDFTVLKYISSGGVGFCF